jgi:hypothetical protein
MTLGAGGAVYRSPRPWDAALERCSATLRVVCRNGRNNRLATAVIPTGANAPQDFAAGFRSTASHRWAASSVKRGTELVGSEVSATTTALPGGRAR